MTNINSINTTTNNNTIIIIIINNNNINTNNTENTIIINIITIPLFKHKHASRECDRLIDRLVATRFCASCVVPYVCRHCAGITSHDTAYPEPCCERGLYYS